MKNTNKKFNLFQITSIKDGENLNNNKIHGFTVRFRPNKDDCAYGSSSFITEKELRNNNKEKIIEILTERLGNALDSLEALVEETEELTKIEKYGTDPNSFIEQ